MTATTWSESSHAVQQWPQAQQQIYNKMAKKEKNQGIGMASQGTVLNLNKTVL